LTATPTQTRTQTPTQTRTQTPTPTTTERTTTIPIYEGNGGLASAQSTTVNIPYPSGINDGDVLIALTTTVNGTNAGIPSGFLTIMSIGFGGNQGHFAMSYKIANGTETGTIVNISNSTTLTSGILYRFSGVNNSTPYEAQTNGNANPGTSIVNNAIINSTGINRLAVGFFIMRGDNNLASMTLGNWTLSDKNTNSLATGNTTQLVIYDLPTTGTNAGQVIANLTSSSYGVTFAIQLKPV
jgi:hypothetical protein